MSTPEELLCSRKWRLVHGWWMIFGWVPFAMTAWIGYLIIGIRAKNWKWILIAAALFAWIVVWIVWTSMTPTTGKGEPVLEEYRLSISLWGSSSLVVWIGNAVGLQWWVNRKWLVWRAHQEKPKPWYATVTRGGAAASADNPRRVDAMIDNAFGQGATVSTLSQVSPKSIALPLAAPAVGEPDSADVAQHVPPPLDINSATIDQLAALPGLDREIAGRIVATRKQVGSFSDTSDLVTRANMKPHILAELRDNIFVEGGRRSVPPFPVSEDPSLPENGRRLEF